jgi:cyclopropane-fatty-acyl-phospholipid synthase
MQLHNTIQETTVSSNKTSLYKLAVELLETADIRINGSRPRDMQLHDPVALEKAFAYGNLGLGEAYMKGCWEVEQLDEFFFRLLKARIPGHIQPLRLIFHHLRSRLMNLQGRNRAWKVGKIHYDLGNDFYEAMLDPRMTYTCAYWQYANDLAEAQEAKLEMVCRKIRLQPGMRVLDIGCGWGSFMAYAAEKYDVECVGVTISQEQTNWARKRYKHLPLEFRLQDYREINEPFDAIVSIGMFEHVGRKNHRAFFDVAHRCLKDEGLFLLHTIGKNVSSSTPDAWIDKYIFPNGDLPSSSQISSGIEELFILEDLHNFGADYDRTLMAWYHNFESNWHRFRHDFDEVFYRMWKYYLLSCAGAFRARDIQLWQWVLSKNGINGGYTRPSF